MSRYGNFHVGASPVHEIASAARRYSQNAGLHVGQDDDYGNVAINQSRSRALGDAYDRLPEFDHNAVPAYKAMREETARQFDFITRSRTKGGMGMDVEVTAHDPYAPDNNFDKVLGRFRNDVVNNNRIQVFSTKSTGGHPFFSNDENDMFRAAHDVFGHLGSGRGIDAHGEEAAFQKHSRMYSPLARQAMATETRGQNGALHKHGEFQEQKVALLPEHMQRAQFATQGSLQDRLKAVQDARIENRKQGI